VLHDVGIESGIDFLVMEYLEGETLARRLEKGPLPVEPALRHAIAIADALDKAHRQGVVHRDLKPGNIMLTKQGVKLLDFGLATLRAERDGPALRIVSGETRLSSLTAEGTIVGTLQYMAPEQLEGKPCDPRTDIFALGSVVHEMVTGKRAFEAGSHTALIGAILEREPPPISSLRPDAPRALDHIVQRCLAKDVDERWQTAGDVMRELKWIGQSASQASLPMPVMAARRRPGRVAALATGLVAGALLGGLAVSLVTPTVDRPATYVAVSVQPAEYLLGPHPMEGSPRVGYRRPSRTAIAISPDGRHLVFAAVQGGTSRLFLRPFDRAEATPIAGTEGADSLFLSPDGASDWILGGWQAETRSNRRGPGLHHLRCAAAVWRKLGIRPDHRLRR
jgi:serine/threonine-protein kinase